MVRSSPLVSKSNRILEEVSPAHLADYEEHDPILITCDDDFSSQGWPGSGTPEAPYVIEGLSMDFGLFNQEIVVD